MSGPPPPPGAPLRNPPLLLVGRGALPFVSIAATVDVFVSESGFVDEGAMILRVEDSLMDECEDAKGVV